MRTKGLIAVALTLLLVGAAVGLAPAQSGKVVKIGDLGEADEIFSRLMGDVVEPRRLFIQENALAVANLDV